MKGTKNIQTRFYLICESVVFGQVLGLGTNVFCCEGITFVDPHPFDVTRFHKLFPYSRFADFLNVGKVKNQHLRSFTFRQKVK